MLRHRLNTADYPAFIVRLFKGRFHLAADVCPFPGAHLRVNPTIGNNLHGPIGKQQINEQAVVVLGIPHPQLRKKLERTISRGLPFEERRAVQCAFHCETDFSNVCSFARLNRFLDRDQGLPGESPVDLPVGQ